MTKKISYILLIIFILIFNSNSYSINLDRSSVYNAIIDNFIKDDEKVISLLESTVKPDLGSEGSKGAEFLLFKLGNESPDTSLALINNFIIKNEKAINLKKYIKSTPKVSWITREYLNNIRCSICPDCEMDNFRKTHLGSKNIYSFSNIEFYKNYTRAMLYVHIDCGGLCVEADILILEKVDNNWKVVKSIMLWCG